MSNGVGPGKGVWSEGAAALGMRRYDVPNVTKQNRAVEMPHLLGAKRTCPLCTGNTFRKAEGGLMDGPMRLLGMQAVRCVNCWRRYYCRGGVAVGE